MRHYGWETGIRRNILKEIAESSRLNKLRAIALLMAGALFLKVLAEILYEYRWYFPADFDSSFLMGRRQTFLGAYRVAFYTHIISGPVALILGCLLMYSGGRPRFRAVHRLAGRAQMLIVIGLVSPSGLVMATQAYTGIIAAYGFAVHSLATGASALAALWCIRARKYQSHRIWATRCFILLCGPLLLRLISGATIVLGVDTDWTYRLTVWFSWLIPLTAYEYWWRRWPIIASSSKNVRKTHLTKEAML